MKTLDEKLQSYARKLQRAKIRKRGNDSFYLKLVESVKPKQCAVCGCTQGLQLHHKDGNWRNPWLHNVEWLCEPHHREADRKLSHHKEKPMSGTRTRTRWTKVMIHKMSEFYTKHLAEGKTLDWCHTNFRSVEGKNKYTSRYHSNKGAYNKHVLYNRHLRPDKWPLGPRGYLQAEVQPTLVKADSAPTITLSQILEYKKMAEAAGYQFILS